MKIFEDKIRKARKVHRCTLCGELIKKGERYVYQTGVDDDGFWTVKAHRECRGYMETKKYPDGMSTEAFLDYVNDDCISYGIKVDSRIEAVKKILSIKNINQKGEIENEN